jgi:ribosome-associated protein
LSEESQRIDGQPESTEEIPENLAIALAAIEDRKGEAPLILDLRELASFTDYMIICSGGSERHVQAIVDAIAEKLLEKKQKALHTEGYEEGKWVLADYVDFIVNVFIRESRDFYQLERVWRDAPVVAGEREGTAPQG